MVLLIWLCVATVSCLPEGTIVRAPRSYSAVLAKLTCSATKAAQSKESKGIEGHWSLSPVRLAGQPAVLSRGPSKTSLKGNGVSRNFPGAACEPGRPETAKDYFKGIGVVFLLREHQKTKKNAKE